MLVFVSWSGSISNRAANALKFWLKTVFTENDIDVWMSEHDIEAGTPWATGLHAHLKSADFGILCMTRENLNSPWLLYEAGALTMTSKSGCVMPFLLDVDSANLPAPLTHFQAAHGDKEGSWKIVKSINTIRTFQMSAEELRKVFENKWPDLARNLGLDIRASYVEEVLVIKPSPLHFQRDEEAHLLRERVGGHFRDGEKQIILDLSEVRHMSSSCMSVLYAGLRVRQQTMAKLVLTNVAPVVLEMLRLTKIDALVRVFPTVEDALRTFKDERSDS